MCVFVCVCVSLYIYCCEFSPVRRAIGHVARMATASPTGTDNSVVTLLELSPETSHGWGFNPTTTTQSAVYPREIGEIAESRYTYGTRTGNLPRDGTAPQADSGHEPLKRFVCQMGICCTCRVLDKC